MPFFRKLVNLLDIIYDNPVLIQELCLAFLIPTLPMRDYRVTRMPHERLEGRIYDARRSHQTADALDRKTIIVLHYLQECGVAVGTSVGALTRGTAAGITRTHEFLAGIRPYTTHFQNGNVVRAERAVQRILRAVTSVPHALLDADIPYRIYKFFRIPTVILVADILVKVNEILYHIYRGPRTLLILTAPDGLQEEMARVPWDNVILPLFAFLEVSILAIGASVGVHYIGIENVIYYIKAFFQIALPLIMLLKNSISLFRRANAVRNAAVANGEPRPSLQQIIERIITSYRHRSPQEREFIESMSSFLTSIESVLKVIARFTEPGINIMFHIISENFEHLISLFYMSTTDIWAREIRFN